MIELLQEYGLAYLYSDGSGLSGLALAMPDCTAGSASDAL